MKTLFCLAFSIFCLYASSQSVTSSSGKSFKNSTYAIDYTLGELQIETYKNTYSQGFHQSTAIKLNVKIDNAVIDINVYPNPVIDYLYITTDNVNLSFTIANAQGIIVYDNVETNKAVDVSFLSAGIYFVSIKEKINKNIIKSFKIVKL